MMANAVQNESQTTEHLLGILASMLRSLPGDSAPRIRLLAKFVEKDYEKIGRLVRLRREYASKLLTVDDEIEDQRKSLAAPDRDDMADEWLSRRLDAGLFTLQVRTFPMCVCLGADWSVDCRCDTRVADCRRRRSKGEVEEPLGRSR